MGLVIRDAVPRGKEGVDSSEETAGLTDPTAGVGGGAHGTAARVPSTRARRSRSQSFRMGLLKDGSTRLERVALCAARQPAICLSQATLTFLPMSCGSTRFVVATKSKLRWAGITAEGPLSPR